MLTRIQLIDFALDQAQLDSSFEAKARMWLNHILLKTGRRRNYLFYNKTVDTAFIPGQSAYAVPADFDRGDACFLVNLSGVQGTEIPLVESYIFDQSLYASVQGTPTIAMIDRQQMKILFNTQPSPGTTASYRLRYFRLPILGSLDSSDDNKVPDFEDQDVLLQELLNLAFEFTDDGRQSTKKGDLKEAYREFEQNMYESDNTGGVDLDRQSFRTRAWVTRRISSSRRF